MSSPFAPVKPIVRAPAQVLFLRLAFALAIVGMLTGWCGAAYCGFNQFTTGFACCFAVMFPCIGFVVFTSFSFHILYFDYSWLGRFIPASPPSSWIPVSSISSGVSIANQYHGPASFQLGPGGVLVYVLPFTGVFIPSRQIVSISNDWWGGGVIEHTSQEIRSPIRVWRSVVREMERCMPELALVRS